MTLNALIFDVDGTLAETEEIHRRAFNETFAEWGLDWNWSQDDYRVLLKTGGGKERIAAFQFSLADTARKLTDDEIRALHKDKTARYGHLIAQGHVTLRPGIADLVEKAREAGMRLALATTTSRPNVEALTQACWGKAAADLFPVIASGDEVARKKPDPEIYLLALKRLGLPPRDCVAFEDSRIGLHSAMGAGLPVVVTPSLYTDEEEHMGAAFRIPDLSRKNWPLMLVARLCSD
ncbi:HAD superfamily hydrolase (TIGR01509 family) [Rhodovulum bhavnagarense]|uniref:HAD superfamily hydrolase (TIGR01509 family) n=1 Tax=Rhodovulum bhavnagarense TaxID=992286 RepID=A0A4R2RKY3_9RHOB|nr:HAD family hydrolase [Rhodovulum bhavnagarense]TCP63229.1 HAD superfamily hydrolase (TIGR01509 family) [Rhodovulum bhavnagarense]